MPEILVEVFVPEPYENCQYCFRRHGDHCYLFGKTVGKGLVSERLEECIEKARVSNSIMEKETSDDAS